MSTIISTIAIWILHVDTVYFPSLRSYGFYFIPGGAPTFILKWFIQLDSSCSMIALFVVVSVRVNQVWTYKLFLKLIASKQYRFYLRYNHFMHSFFSLHEFCLVLIYTSWMMKHNTVFFFNCIYLKPKPD